MTLSWVDHGADAAAWARSLGVTPEACELLLDAHFIDLHLDLHVPVRLFGYDPAKRHGPWNRVMPFFGHTDLPRLKEAGLTGVVYDIATNVFRRQASRQRVTLDNLRRVVELARRHDDELALVRTRSDYEAARAAGKLALWPALQGGNALAHDPSVLDGPTGDLVHRITLVHLTSSVLGGSNSPSQPDGGLTDRGRSFVAACNDNRVLVDLSHAGVATFWDAIEVHRVDLPPIVSHTGMASIRSHWRNIDDDQARAIADRGGVIGVIYNGNFLDEVPTGLPCKRAAILDHLERIIEVAGEGVPAIGTDYDGVITPPSDLRDVTHHPLLVQDMLARGWSEARIRRILGENYLRVVGEVRP